MNRRTPFTFFQRSFFGAAGVLAAVVALLSCGGGEPTRPVTPVTNLASLRFTVVIPELAQGSAFIDITSYDRAHVIVRRASGVLATDTTLMLSPNSRSVAGQVTIALASSTATSEAVSLEFSIVDSRGTVVFRSVPATVNLTPNVGGQSSTPTFAVTVAYAGPGATVKTLRIQPRTVDVIAGGTFTLTATAQDSAGAVVAGAPVAWYSLDPARATITVAGAGVALAQRGPARIVAQSIVGAADTVIVNSLPVAASIMMVSGSDQTGSTGAPGPLAKPLVVRVMATDGLPLANVAVTFEARNGGSVSPASATTDATGLAQTMWTLGNVVGPQTAMATAAVAQGGSVLFSATAVSSPATRLAFTTAPSNGAVLDAATPLSVSVAAMNDAGEVVTSFTGNVTLAVASGPPQASLGGVTSVSASAGVATFTGLSLGTAGTSYTLSASASGLTAATSPQFTVTGVVVPGLAMNISSGNNQTDLTGTTLLPIYVKVTDAGRNGVERIPVTFSVGSGGGTATPGATVTGAFGFAQTSWTLGPMVGTQTIIASSPGIPSVTISATATQRPAHFVFTQQPSITQTSLLPITPALVVELRDPLDRLVTSYNGPVTLGFGANGGNGEISGDGTVNAVSGVATFSNARIDRAGGYQLAAIQTGYLSGLSSPFAVVPGAPASLRVTGGNDQIAAGSATLPFPVSFSVTDAAGNGVSGVTVSLVTAGGGTVTPATVVTNGTGSFDATWTLGPSGTQSLIASAPGLPSATATATIGGPRLVITGPTSLGTRQRGWLDANRVGIPVRSATPVVITLESLDPTIATVPSSVTIPTGATEAMFLVTSYDRIGSAQIRATAPGFSAVSTTAIVTRARFIFFDAPAYLFTKTPRSAFNVFATDSTGEPHFVTEDVVISVGTSTPGVISVDVPTVTIASGNSYSTYANVLPVAPGRATLTATDTRGTSYAYLPAAYDFNVSLTPASLSTQLSVGLDQYVTGYLSLGYRPTSPITTPLVFSANAHTMATPATIVHAAGEDRVSMRITALSIGTDTISATPPGQATVSRVITVDRGMFGMIEANPVRVGDSAQVFVDLQGPTGSGGVFAAVPTTLTLTPSSGVKLVSGGSASVPVTTITIPVGASRVGLWAKGVSSGPASVTVSAANYITYVWPLGVSP